MKANRDRSKLPDLDAAARSSEAGTNLCVAPASAMQQLVNSSPRMRVQRKLIDSFTPGARTSGAVVQKMRVAPQPVLMRRSELRTDRLNVAGENHGVSNARRDREIRLANEYVHGGYWMEREFRVASDGLLGAMGARPRRADPPVLKVANNIKLMIPSSELSTLVESFEPMPQTLSVDALLGSHRGETAGSQSQSGSSSGVVHQAPSTKGRRKQLMEGYLAGQADSLRELLLLINQMLELRETLSLSRAQRALPGRVRDIGGRMMAALVDTESSWRALARDPENDSLYLELQAAATRVNQAQQALTDLAQEVSSGSERDTSRERSGHMHEAANNRANEPGIWKVGNAHVADMSRWTRAYNLLTESEFQMELDSLVPVATSSQSASPSISTTSAQPSTSSSGS